MPCRCRESIRGKVSDKAVEVQRFCAWGGGDKRYPGAIINISCRWCSFASESETASGPRGSSLRRPSRHIGLRVEI